MISGPARRRVLCRAVQTTIAASAGFYLCLYGLDEPVAALYSLFAAIALGPLSPISGSGRQRAGAVMRALPAGLLLVVLGTVLAVSTWAAVAGMLVVGFALGFAAVGSPRSAATAPGLQLFYILACFPPYAPQTLWARLAGAALGGLSLAACNAFLFPDPPDRGYRARLADALETAAEAARGDVPLSCLRDRAEDLRLSQVPPGERPTGPGRADRALSQAGSAARRLLETLTELSHARARGAVPDDGEPCEDLLACVADYAADAARALRTGGAAPSVARLEAVANHVQTDRIRRATPPRRLDLAVMRRQSLVLQLAAAMWVLVTALGIAERRATRRPPEGDVFWYADLPAYGLWARRIAGNLTGRSVWFQNAVRVALGLAAARLVAGTLDLAHGFWVLLAVLTLGRTTVGATWGAVRQALAGTLAGAAAAGVLILTLGQHVDIYAALLVPAMLVAFVLGPLLGIGYAQGLFTLLVAVVFAQVAPVDWQLSEVRLFDVLTGSCIGLLCGLLAWPAGGRREVRRTMAELLRACGTLLPTTADLVTNPAPGQLCTVPTLPVERRLRLAEAAYAQYRTEPTTAEAPPHADWLTVLVLAHQTLHGSHQLLHFDLAGEDLSREHAPGAPVLVDLDVWLTTVAQQLDRIASSLPPCPR
ncbi:FUSC family protein [Streptomyces sp. NPDC086787]|uniref:FUSC family protein n=1 Tax=Streptomyces sp. NPDC086787 TaxID=3365759 RepID=UPI0038307491